MDLKGSCQHCGQHLTFPANMTGDWAACPHCGQQTQLTNPNLTSCPDCLQMVSVNAPSCPHCGVQLKALPSSAPPHPIPTPAPSPVQPTAPRASSTPSGKARLNKKAEMAGKGCLIQAAGIALGILSLCSFALGPIVGFIGLFTFGITAIVLLVYGGRVAFKWQCGGCGNPVADGEVKICPHCQVVLVK